MLHEISEYHRVELTGSATILQGEGRRFKSCSAYQKSKGESRSCGSPLLLFPLAGRFLSQDLITPAPDFPSIRGKTWEGGAPLFHSPGAFAKIHVGHGKLGI